MLQGVDMGRIGPRGASSAGSNRQEEKKVSLPFSSIS